MLASASGAALLIGRAGWADDADNFTSQLRDIADRPMAEKIVADLIGDRTPREGVVRITAPDLAENGAAVPFTITVDADFAAGEHPTTVHLVALENPYPELARYHFTQACGEAEISGRCRMADTGPLVVVANMSDGSVATAEVFVEVTVGGCG